MELNADFTRRVAVHAAHLPWVPSPVIGIERRMLDRIGAEVARATSIVRYAAESRFNAHTHGGGEEFMVLDGVFSDEHGDFPSGSYVRNPPGSTHTPGSQQGCTIFVKLRQFDSEDRTVVRIDTGKLEFLAVPTRPGVHLMPLHADAHEDVRIERWARDAAIEWVVDGGIELLVLDGSFEEGGERFTPQSWLRLPPGASLHATAGAYGCRVWVKTGHLARLG
ncbi:cupin domain-containing protein [Pararobbsia alpina]|uniref:ChrR-like cupin domain-containing protein n=1 Tax=Pararobbsia alpina TaxID=621374 RepID=A0A6S7B124_9BURK|nr:cupin domain-containing protein [Pararobbsia alpina]CAB3783636.1 hypothetical protein LMG28138_01680 [Pararobbsia alpina]